MNNLEDLVGKTVIEVRMDATNTNIQFQTDAGVLSYTTYGECCSESWINHISGLQAIIDQKVLKIPEIEMGEITKGQEGFSGKQKVDSIYSFKIFTSQGVCELEMRNASNGYYGGSLFKSEYTGNDCKIVTEDF